MSLLRRRYPTASLHTACVLLLRCTMRHLQSLAGNNKLILKPRCRAGFRSDAATGGRRGCIGQHSAEGAPPASGSCPGGQGLGAHQGAVRAGQCIGWLHHICTGCGGLSGTQAAGWFSKLMLAFRAGTLQLAAWPWHENQAGLLSIDPVKKKLMACRR